MKKIISLILIILFCTINIKTYAAKQLPAKTILELRDIQTRTFDTPDEMLVAKAVINTLQDNGFIIQNIEPDLGYIRAKKEFKAKRTDKGRVTLYCAEFAYYGIMTGLSFGINAPFLIIPTMHMKNELALHSVVIDSNINIEKIGKRTKVRFTLIEKVLENGDGYTTVKSSPRKVVRHYEQEIYQEFFNQVDKNLFMEKNL